MALALTFLRTSKFALRFRHNLIALVPYRNMANSKFEYIREYELDDKLLLNCWIVIRIDGIGFDKFSKKHEFIKPNDVRGLNLMNRAAVGVMEKFHELILAYGQSDEYSFVFKRSASVYNRRGSKIISAVTSLFTSMYVYHWSNFFDEPKPKYPPSFDGRYILYPTDKDLFDYLSWRQADLHINNLYNTTFWNLVLKSGMTPVEAEERLSGTVAADKNEILFSEFNINYNNEPLMFKKGTILLRKKVGKYNVIVDHHEDMIKEEFWKTRHPELLENKDAIPYDSSKEVSNLAKEQIERRKQTKKKVET